MTHLVSLRSALLAGVALSAFTVPAMALDADAFGARLAAVYATAGYDLAFGPGKVDGDTITFDGVTVALIGIPEAPGSFKLDSELTFSEVEEYDDGSYYAGTLKIADVDITEEDAHVTLANIEFTNVYVPGGDDLGIVDLMQNFTDFRAGPLAVEVEGKQLFSIAEIGSTSTLDPEQGSGDLTSVTGEGWADGIVVDLTSIEEPEAKAVIDALGLSTINGSAVQTVSWTLGDGHMAITESSVTLEDIGKIDFTMDLVGYTAAVLEDMMATQAEMMQMLEDGNDEGQAQIEQMFTTRMMDALSLGGVSVRFDDEGITNRLLDMFAAQQGITREQFVAGIQVMIPAMMADLPIVKQATDALSAFLNDPKNLEVRAQPSEPTSFAKIAEGAVDPATAVDLLGITVTANQ